MASHKKKSRARGGPEGGRSNLANSPKMIYVYVFRFRVETEQLSPGNPGTVPSFACNLLAIPWLFLA